MQSHFPSVEQDDDFEPSTSQPQSKNAEKTLVFTTFLIYLEIPKKGLIWALVEY